MDLGKAPAGHADPVFDAADLTRHTVVFGSTGSGKTGLVVDLVEEMVGAGVSVVAIDPKGDLARLLLGPLGQEVPTNLIAPGSRAGDAISLLSTLSSPPDPDDVEGFTQALGDVARGVLSLTGAKGGPMDPPQLLVTGVLDAAWRAGEPIGLHDLVVRLVDPPFPRIGAFPVDTVMPRADRMKLAIELNGWLASPQLAGFAEGRPLDPDEWVARPSLTVVYLAHLDDTLRSLAAGMVLSRVATWSRRQPGSERPRLGVVLDEAWGYCPPAPRDPVTKRPLMQLAKQGRSVGVALVSATQNPVDLDYALLSNAATWFVGRLATPQDREKVSDGASAQARQWLADLPKRTFLVRRSGREELLVTRNCRTPLGGPLTLADLPRREAGAAMAPRPAAPAEPTIALSPTPPASDLPARWLDPSVAFTPRWSAIVSPRAVDRRTDGATVWEPALLCRLKLKFDEGRTVVAEREELRLSFPIGSGWVEPAEGADDDLSRDGDGVYAPLEGVAKKDRDRLARDVIEEVLRGETEQQWVHDGCKLRSTTGEGEEAFRARVRAVLEDKAADAVAKLEGKVRKEVERLEAKRAKVEASLTQKKADRDSRMATEVVGAGETLLGLLFGRKRSLTPLASRRGATMKADAALDRAEQDLKDLEREIYDKEAELADEIEALRNEQLRRIDEIRRVEVGLEREDIDVVDWTVVWIPVSRPV
ncbi:MAG: DUF853 family protein [Alphaproteobacteria bacterium]|nr:DUF853 family protein [Alphaproteobacteria bacterium]MCB9696368.1 DUF853 family protein [Alphaproteobacteria bacterium]